MKGDEDTGLTGNSTGNELVDYQEDEMNTTVERTSKDMNHIENERELIGLSVEASEDTDHDNINKNQENSQRNKDEECSSIDIIKKKVEDDTEVYDHIKDIDNGWAWVVLIACFLSNSMSAGLVNSAGLVQSILLERFGQKVSLTTWVTAIHGSLLFFGAPLSSVVVDAFSCRTSLMAAGAVFATGSVLTVFSPSVEVTILTYGLIAGTGAALSGPSSYMAVGFYFRKRRNIALGIALSGVGVGVFVFANLVQLARDYYGSVGCFFAIASIVANVTTCGAICCPSPLELAAKRKRKQQRLKYIESGKKRSNFYATVVSYTKAVLTKGTVCLWVSFFTYVAGTAIVYLHLPSIIVNIGFSRNRAAFLISLTGLLSIPSRTITGIVAHSKKVNEIFVYCIPLIILCIATFGFPYYVHSYVGQVVYVVCVGLFYGCLHVVNFAVNEKFVGTEYITAAIGIEFFFGGLGGIIAPVISGVIIDNGGTYDQVFFIAASLLLIASLTGAALFLCPKRDDKESRSIHHQQQQQQQPLVKLDTEI